LDQQAIDVPNFGATSGSARTGEVEAHAETRAWPVRATCSHFLLRTAPRFAEKILYGFSIAYFRQ
jgi:hypothetical protein